MQSNFKQRQLRPLLPFLALTVFALLCYAALIILGAA
jgi:hypothetical protein